MSEEFLIPINLWLAGRSYRIRIKPEEEEAVRKSVKAADEKINEFRRGYAGKDDQDFIAMCLLMYAVDNTTESFKNPVLQQELLQLVEKIDKALED
ncbi:MAG TPA: cell division protein ZapA [Flavipsychrobacter sp.]|nr:cell division protein ZapA [Flavipsychrobacter sp.]